MRPPHVAPGAAARPVARHAPAPGRWARLLGRFEVTGAFWFRFHEFGVRVAPEWSKALLIRAFAGLFFVALRRIRRAVLHNLEPVLGPAGFAEAQRRIYRTFHAFAWCLTERYESLSTPASFRFETENAEAWEATLASEGGFIFLTAHLGNWEVGAAQPRVLASRRIHLVREPEMDPRAQAFIAEILQKRLGDHVTTHFAANDHGLGMTLLDALRRGEIVALQGDRPRAGGRTVEVSLFGRPYDLPCGPFALARAAGVPLLPVFAIRAGRRHYRMLFCDPVAVPEAGSREDNLRRAATSVARGLEAAIRRHPHQWFCFANVWER